MDVAIWRRKAGEKRMENEFLQVLATALTGPTAAALTGCNEKTARFGLILSPAEAAALLETRAEALRSSGRIEFGPGVMQKMILAFCDSPYLCQSNYTETLQELIEIFYYFKNECQDKISDDELIEWMKKYYDTSCEGSLDLLRNRELEQMAFEIRHDRFDFDGAPDRGAPDGEEDSDG